jgi:putative hemolysin
MLNNLAFASLQRVSSTLQSMYQMRLNGIHRFKPKVEIYSEMGPMIIKTAESSQELKAALRLRYEIFHQELAGKVIPMGIDIDEYDLNCDHLLIIEKKTGRIVGTYRMNSTLFSTKFYSEREFNIRRILEQPGEKLELGRACIHKDFRRGIVIALLWRGIAEYMNATKSQILFGCASVMTTHPREAALLYKHFLEENRLRPEYAANPTSMYVMPDLRMWMYFIKTPLTLSEKKEALELLPPLCRSYIKMGALIAGEPAWDHEFKCIDFLTILRREDLNKTLWKRYKITDEL